MKYSGSSRHSLYFTWLDNSIIAKIVLVFKLAIYNISYYLHVLVLVKIKACPRLYHIIVEDTQRSKADFVWIKIFCKGKVVICCQPIKFSLVLLFFFCNLNHV